MNCPVCTKPANFTIDLVQYPVTEIYKKFGEDKKTLAYMDQSFEYCHTCSHALLGRHLPRDFIYNNYNTVSSSSSGSVLALVNFLQFVQDRANFGNADVVDIGANDTSLLSEISKCRDKPRSLTGIDPNIKSDSSEIEIISCYFEDLEKSFSDNKNNIFLCSHTLEHIYCVDTFFEKLDEVSNNEDLFFFQFPSLEYLVIDGRFDQVHHQHINYFSLYSFSILLARHGFKIVDYQYDRSHYGTLITQIGKKGGKKSFVKQSLITEEYIHSRYKLFKDNMTLSNELLNKLDGNFYCYGASLMLPIINYYLPNLIECIAIIDSNSKKHNLCYINFDKEIIGEQELQFSENNLIVTALSTKEATRKILIKLIERKALNVILPLNII